MRSGTKAAKDAALGPAYLYGLYKESLQGQRPHREDSGASPGTGQGDTQAEGRGNIFYLHPLHKAYKLITISCFFSFGQNGYHCNCKRDKTDVKEKIIMKKKFVAIAAAATLVMGGYSQAAVPQTLQTLMQRLLHQKLPAVRQLRKRHPRKQ